MLENPIPALYNGRAVHIFGTILDGRCLIAYDDDGKTDLAPWGHPNLTLRDLDAPAPAERTPPEPWGEWTMRHDPTWGEVWTRRRNFGMESQFVRTERDGWCWRWGVTRSGDGFETPEDAMAACEGFTVRKEGVPAAPTKEEEPVGEWTEWQQVSPWGTLLRKHTTRDCCQRINPTDGGWYWREAVNGREGARHGPFPSFWEAIADCDTITGASTLDTDTTTNSIAGLDAAGGAE